MGPQRPLAAPGLWCFLRCGELPALRQQDRARGRSRAPISCMHPFCFRIMGLVLIVTLLQGFSGRCVFCSVSLAAWGPQTLCFLAAKASNLSHAFRIGTTTGLLWQCLSPI